MTAQRRSYWVWVFVSFFIEYNEGISVYYKLSLNELENECVGVSENIWDKEEGAKSLERKFGKERVEKLKDITDKLNKIKADLEKIKTDMQGKEAKLERLKKESAKESKIQAVENELIQLKNQKAELEKKLSQEKN
jgi:uncharacterized protein (DUF342 family)